MISPVLFFLFFQNLNILGFEKIDVLIKDLKREYERRRRNFWVLCVFSSFLMFFHDFDVFSEHKNSKSAKILGFDQNV